MQSNVKFGLKYKLVYQVKSKDGSVIEQIQITAIENDLNITCDFEIERTFQSELNKARFTITNLSPPTRNKMVKDRYDTRNYVKMWFYMGYGSQLNLVFTGNVLATETDDDSIVSGVTIIEALDGSFLVYNTYSQLTVAQNTSFELVFNKLFDDLKKSAQNLQDDFTLQPLTADAKKELSQRTYKAMSFSGNTWETMKTIFPDGLFIDNNVLYYLPKSAKKDNEVFVLQADTGLQKAPKISNTVLMARTICEPTIQVGDMVEVRTTRINRFTGKQYQVYGVNHKGIIGKNIASKVITTLNLGIFNIK